MKIAAVNWKLREIKDEEEFYDHLRELLDQCRDCDLIVLPELFSLELLPITGAKEDEEIPAALAHYHLRTFFYLDEWRKAKADRLLLVHGSHIAWSRGFHVNRCEMTTSVDSAIVEKQVLTEWEQAIGVQAGDAGLQCLKSHLVGVTICLDAEFPASGRALAEAGMLFQCVPAWTETLHGFQRVRWACQARAVENQVCVIHSSLVGRVGNEESHGSSAIIVPPHLPFPLDPVLAETPMDEEGIAFAEVDPEDLLRCREMGEVRNWRDRDLGDWTVRTV